MTRSYESCHNLQDLMTDKVLPSKACSPTSSDTDSEASYGISTPTHLQQLPRTESKASLEWKMQRQQCAYRFFVKCQPRLRLAWACHFVASWIVLSFSLLSSESVSRQKYIPISSSSVHDLLENDDCFKGFVNVFAESQAEENALLLCCQNDSDTGICPASVRT